ncbi:MAG: hypothetical protein V4719_10225 [Planctomycetota bacterium]
MTKKQPPGPKLTPAQREVSEFNQRFDLGAAVVLNERSSSPGVESFIVSKPFTRTIEVALVRIAGGREIPLNQINGRSNSIDPDRDE